MSYLGTLNSLLSTTTSRYNSLRRTLLSSSSEEADTKIDDPDSSHVSCVLRAYYTEKGRPFPPWLPPDPHARPTASPQSSFVASAGSLRGAGRNPGGSGATTTPGGRGGGLSDLWADNSSTQQPQQDSGSLRRGLAGARLGRNRAQEGHQGQNEALAPRPLPSQKAGSYQNSMGQSGGGGSGSYGGAMMSPPGSAGSTGGSVQERLKARLGGRGAVTPPLTREGSGRSSGGFEGTGGSYGPSSGGNPYSSGGYGSGDPYGGGGGYDGGAGVRRKPPPGQSNVGLSNGPRQR